MVKYELFSRQPQQNGPSQPQQPGVLENLRKIILQKQNTKNLLQIPSSRVTFLLSTLQEIIHTQLIAVESSVPEILDDFWT